MPVIIDPAYEEDVLKIRELIKNTLESAFSNDQSHVILKLKDLGN